MKSQIILTVLLVVVVACVGSLVRKQQEEINQRVFIAMVEECQAQNWTGHSIQGGCSFFVCDEWAVGCQDLKRWLDQHPEDWPE